MSSPVDFDTVQRALYTWFSTGTGLPVVWAGQKMPQRNREPGFGVLQLLSVSMPPSIDVDEQRTVEANAELYRQWVGTRRIVVNAQVVTYVQQLGDVTAFFQGHALNFLGSAQAALRGSATLDDASITFVSDSPMTDLTAVAGEGFETRASLDVTIDVQSIFTETIPTGWFNKAVINGKQIGPP